MNLVLLQQIDTVIHIFPKYTYQAASYCTVFNQRFILYDLSFSSMAIFQKSIKSGPLGVCTSNKIFSSSIQIHNSVSVKIEFKPGDVHRLSVYS